MNKYFVILIVLIILFTLYALTGNDCANTEVNIDKTIEGKKYDKIYIY